MADPTLVELLAPERVLLDRAAPDWETAVRMVGGVLVDAGAVEEGYVDAMLARERSVAPTFVGEGVAIPHGTNESRSLIRQDALCAVQFPTGVDWQGDQVVLCIGIAVRGDVHVPVLAQLAELLMDPDRADALRRADSTERLLALLTPEPEPS